MQSKKKNQTDATIAYKNSAATSITPHKIRRKNWQRTWYFVKINTDF